MPSTQTIPDIVAPKACTHSPNSFWSREFKKTRLFGLIFTVAYFLRAYVPKISVRQKKIEAMQEWSLVSVKVEPRSTSHLSSSLFHLGSIFIIYVIKINVRNQKTRQWKSTFSYQ